jgi:hypothetical protein
MMVTFTAERILLRCGHFVAFETVPDSPFVLDSGPADKTVSPVRTSLGIKATPTPIYRGQEGSSPEN